jgi:hypothetical protein
MMTEVMNCIAKDRYCPPIAQTAAPRTLITAGSRSGAAVVSAGAMVAVAWDIGFGLRLSR